MLILYEKREKSFANGRDMRKLFQNIMSNFSDRVSQLAKDERTDQALNTIIYRDVIIKKEDNISIENIISDSVVLWPTPAATFHSGVCIQARTFGYIPTTSG